MTELSYDCRNRLIKAGGVTYEYDAGNTRTAVITETSRTEYVTDAVSTMSQVLEAYITYTDKNAEEADTEDRTQNITKYTAITYICGNGLIYEYKEETADGDDKEQSNRENTGNEDIADADNINGYNNNNSEENITEHILVHHYNNIGSTTALTDENGDIVSTYLYGAYGELSGGDTTKTAYLYNGMYGVSTDTNGLYYMRARYYNTDIKRFINRDVVSGSMGNSQSLNRYSYVQGNPIKLTDPFGLSPFSGKNLAHGILNALGMIPGLGDIADLINAAWYLHDKDYKNAALSALSALPAVGEFAGLTFLAKTPKAAKYVKLTTKVIGHGSTFALAASGGINSAIQIYHNTREGKFFTIQNLMDVTNVGLSVFTMICSGKQTFESGRELAGMLKQDVPAVFSKAKQALSSAWSSIKNQAIRLRYDTGGFVDLDVLKEPISFRNGGNNIITVSPERLQHSVLGEFNSNNRLINGGHGQANIDYLNEHNIPYNIVHVYDNGVRVGNIPNHKNAKKAMGIGQAWFPESWTEIDIKNAGEYVANLPENINVPYGQWTFGEYKGVRVGVIKNEKFNGIGTILPDNSRQP